QADQQEQIKKNSFHCSAPLALYLVSIAGEQKQQTRNKEHNQHSAAGNHKLLMQELFNQPNRDYK
ncbi:MAG: hypothetical protein ABIK92_11925, partial [Pseudomonadota bacterium]